MKIRTLALATAIAVTATGYAFAQAPASPTEHAGSKASDTSTSGTMSKDTMAKDKMMKSSTTGAGPTDPNKAPAANDISPANAAKDNKNKGN
jgi:pentapeptide MXKDX repeat protein